MTGRGSRGTMLAVGTACSKPAAFAGALALVVYPLLPLGAYYAEVLADGRTNQPLFQLTASILAQRQPGELVLVDEGLAQEALGAGGTDLKAVRMLLEGYAVPYRVVKVGEAEGETLGPAQSALFLLEIKKRQDLPRALRATPLSPEVASASGSGHRYAVYRLAAR